MLLTPPLDIWSIHKYYPNLSTEQKSIINQRANSIIDCINSPHLMRVSQYEGNYSSDKKTTKIVLPLNIYGQFGSNHGLSEWVILSWPHEWEKLKRADREQGIITLCYELDKNFPGNDRLRSLFLHNMESIKALSIEEQLVILRNNGINSIEELSQLIRDSVNYKPIVSNNIYNLFAETKIFKKIP